MARTIDAVVAGNICFDIIPEFPRKVDSLAAILRPGSVVEMGPATTATGGPVANTGMALQRLGASVVLNAKVGDDDFGQAVLTRLRAAGLDGTMTTVPSAQTSHTVVLAPPGIDRMFLHHAGLNATFGVDDVRWDDVARARVFHLGYPPLMARMIADGGADGGAEMTETFRRAKAAGATTSLDMSLPDAASAAGKIDWRAIMARTLPHVDLFLPSAEEALFLFDRAECAARAGAPDILDTFTGARMTHLSEEALAMGAGVALIKCGHRGAYVRTAGTARLAATLCPPSWANRELWEPAFHVEHVAGATGSGDAAIAGFLASLLRGLELENALTMATAVGACNVMAPDALSGILDWDDTQSKVASAWKKSELTITDTGWRWSEKGNRWHGPADGKPPHKPL